MKDELRDVPASGSLGAPGAPFVWASASALILIAACGLGEQDPRLLTIDGSSTVYPLVEAMAEDFLVRRPEFRITIGVSGTGGGFQKFCAGGLDVAAASREVSASERALCRGNGVEPVRFPLALDGITLVTHRDNRVTDCLTTTELRDIWEPNSRVQSWRDIRPDFPEEELHLYGPGVDSGTLDFFTTLVMGRPQATRSDYYQSEDDFLIARGVAGDPWALGYFGHAYFVGGGDALRALAVDFGFGCVFPDASTISDGRYGPLTRELALYVDEAALSRPAVRDFLEAVLHGAGEAAGEIGYVPLPDDEYRRAQARLDASAPPGGV